MRRLYFLTPDVPTATTIVDELLLARIGFEHIHVLAREDTPLGELPQAGLVQKTDLIASIERGLGLGGAVGMLGGLIVVSIPGLAVISAGPLLVSLTVAGAALGTWLSSMIGVSVDSPRLKRYEDAINNGQLLMMVDVPAKRVDEIESLVSQRHPSAMLGGTEPDIPAFP